LFGFDLFYYLVVNCSFLICRSSNFLTDVGTSTSGKFNFTKIETLPSTCP